MHLVVVRLFCVVVAVLLLCLVEQPAVAAEAPPGKKQWEPAEKLMPQDQTETIAQMKKIEKRRNAASNEPDAEKRRLFTEIRNELDTVNKKVAKEGVKDWIGLATLTGQDGDFTSTMEVVLDFGFDSEIKEARQITISLADMPKSPFATVTKWGKSSQWVKFTVAPDAKEPLVFEASGTVIRGTAPGKTLTEINNVSVGEAAK